MYRLIKKEIKANEAKPATAVMVQGISSCHTCTPDEHVAAARTAEQAGFQTAI